MTRLRFLVLALSPLAIAGTILRWHAPLFTAYLALTLAVMIAYVGIAEHRHTRQRVAEIKARYGPIDRPQEAA